MYCYEFLILTPNITFSKGYGQLIFHMFVDCSMHSFSLEKGSQTLTEMISTSPAVGTASC